MMNNNVSSSIYNFRATPGDPPEQFTPSYITKLQNQIKQFKIFQKLIGTNFTDTNNTYFLLSTKFIREWKKYSGYDARQAGNPQPATGIRPAPFNQDLVQRSKDFVAEPDSNSIYFQVLRTQILQKNHFIIVTQQIMNMFLNNYKGIVLPRKLYTNPSKKIQLQIHLPRVNFIVISQETIKPLIKNDKLPIMKGVISSTATVDQWKHNIAKYWINGYLDVLDNKGLIQKPKVLHKKIRLWQIEGVYKLNQYFSKLKKLNKQSSQCQIEKSKEINQQTNTFMSLFISKQDIIIVQYVDEQYSLNYIFKVRLQSCSYCGQQNPLKQSCKCNTAQYCSLECKKNDDQHKLKCTKLYNDQIIKFQINNSSLKGKVGLKNLGNTCFMNSAIQCLSHSKYLTNYFLSTQYQKDINIQNPIGTNGKLVNKYALTLKNLWCQTSKSFVPSGLKSVIGQVQPMFAGYNQHDSQQFLMFMLDSLHQDLNRVLQKPYIQKQDSKLVLEQELANQSWQFYKKRNKSIIVDLFCGQYKSELNCPKCKYKSITFDTFMNLTLPIPMKQQVTFYFMPYGRQVIFYKVDLTIQQPNIQKMVKTFAKQLGPNYDHNRLRFMFLNNIIIDAMDLSFSQVQQKMIDQELYCLQLLPQQVICFNKNNSYNKVMVKFSKSSINKNKGEIIPVSRPFWFIIHSFSIRQLQKRIWGWMYKACIAKNVSVVDNQQNAFNLKFTNLNNLPFRFYLKVVQKQEISYYYKQKVQLSSKDKLASILSNLKDDCSIQYIQCNLDNFNFCDYNKFSTFVAFNIDKSAMMQEQNTHLTDCFQKFRKPQVLTNNNKWKCPKCKQQVCATKTMSLYKTSKYLIVHLKRFKQKSATSKIKIVKYIDFPIKLDLDKYLANKKPPMNQIKQEVQLFNNKKANYELYGVINHSGNLAGGHYIAYALNNEQWYKFDDDYVKKISESQVITQDAYVLFYERK